MSAQDVLAQDPDSGRAPVPAAEEVSGPGARPAPGTGGLAGTETLEHEVARLRTENAVLRESLLRWRVAAVAKWAETAADAMKTASQVKDLKRQLRDSELDRLDVAHRHHQLNQVHHQLNERYLTLSRRYGRISRVSELTGSQVKRRLHRVLGER